LIFKVKNKCEKSNESTHTKVIKFVLTRIIAYNFKGRTYKYL